MDSVTIKELRSRGGDVVDRVAGGVPVTVTRDGKPVAELRPLPRPALHRDALLERFRRLPPMDLERFRADVDAVLDPYA